LIRRAPLFLSIFIIAIIYAIHYSPFSLLTPLIFTLHCRGHFRFDISPFHAFIIFVFTLLLFADAFRLF